MSKSNDQSLAKEPNSKLYPEFKKTWELRNENYKYLQGRLFTVIDAITESHERKKAVKDLIKEVLSSFDKIQREQHLHIFWGIAHDLDDAEMLNHLKRIN